MVQDGNDARLILPKVRYLGSPGLPGPEPAANHDGGENYDNDDRRSLAELGKDYNGLSSAIEGMISLAQDGGGGVRGEELQAAEGHQGGGFACPNWPGDVRDLAAVQGLKQQVHDQLEDQRFRSPHSVAQEPGQGRRGFGERVRRVVSPFYPLPEPGYARL